MGISVLGDEALSLLVLLKKIDEGYSVNSEELDYLSSITEFSLSWEGMTFIPNSIDSLTNLEVFHFSHNEISALPNSICFLTKLIRLDVSNNNIAILPDSIGDLNNLRYINVSHNRLKELPNSIVNLSNLEELWAYENVISQLPADIGKLSQLRVLNLYDNLLKVVPESISSCTKLEELIISKNRLVSFPDISALNALKHLNIRNNCLSNLPNGLFNLEDLELLALGYNSIRIIDKRIGDFCNLSFIDLSGMILHDIPESIVQKKLPYYFDENDYLKHEHGVFLYQTKLVTQPISLFMQNDALIEEYFKEEKIPVNEAKVIFLGDGDVGKTYTIKRLLNHGRKEYSRETYATSTTHGIIISPYPIADDKMTFDIKLWDFGGQHIMHSMHRCFLTERTCYVVVLSTRTDRDLLSQARYWLKTIDSFASGSPVIVFTNQWTSFTQTVDEKRLRDEFSNVLGFLNFSAVEALDDVFLQLRKMIISQVQEMDSYGMDFPRKWYSVKKEISDLASQGKYYINQKEYYRICYDNGMLYNTKYEQEDIYDWLLNWLNDLGICFSYHKNTNNQRLFDYKLLNPEWLTNAAYIIITKGYTVAQNGVLSKNQILYLLNAYEGESYGLLGGIKYQEYEIEYVLDVLRKFWISYSIADNEEFFPILCPENSDGRSTPSWWNSDTDYHVSYEYVYKYLPETVIHRLMIYCYQNYYIIDSRWRKGMRIEFESDSNINLCAVVDMGGEKTAITIDVYSDGVIPPWAILHKLRQQIQEINNDMNLQAEDYIVISDNGERDVFPVENVLNRQARNKTDMPGKNRDYEIADILGTAFGNNNVIAARNAALATNSNMSISLIDESIKNNWPSPINVRGNLNVYIENYYQNKSEDITKLLDLMLIHQEYVNDRFLNELAEILCQQEETREIGISMRQQPDTKSKMDTIRDNIGLIANLTSIVTTIGPRMINAASTYAPKLIEALQKISDIIPK